MELILETDGFIYIFNLLYSNTFPAPWRKFTLQYMTENKCKKNAFFYLSRLLPMIVECCLAFSWFCYKGFSLGGGLLSFYSWLEDTCFDRFGCLLKSIICSFILISISHWLVLNITQKISWLSRMFKLYVKNKCNVHNIFHYLLHICPRIDL